jgi:hypothetical protein
MILSPERFRGRQNSAYSPSKIISTELTARMPDAAKRDLIEWTPSVPAGACLQQILSHESSTEHNSDPNPQFPFSDDQPCNEYFLLREHGLF